MARGDSEEQRSRSEAGEGPSSDLPSLYRNPWRVLLEALTAAWADLGLRLRELWRRNRQGDLPRPRRWPQAVAPLFWPLLLTLLLALGAVALRLTLPRRASPDPAQATPASSAPSTAGSATAESEAASLPAVEARPAPPLEPPAAVEPTPGSPETPLAETASPQALPTELPDTQPWPVAGTDIPTRKRLVRWWPQARRPNLPPPSGSQASAVAEANQSSAGQDPASPSSASQAPAVLPPVASPPLSLDPLLSLLSGGSADPWLQTAQADAAAGLLSLTLSEAATSLSDRTLLERAGLWQQRALEAGYERLELRDPQGRLRGRQALVGSGMILLAPDPLP